MRDEMIKTLRADPNLRVLTQKNIEVLVDNMLKSGHYVIEDHGFAFYIKCDDETLEHIQRNKHLLTDPKYARELLTKTGKHIHFIGVYSTTPLEDGSISILRGMHRVAEREKSDTLSWYNRTLEKFIIRRVSWLP